MFHSWRNHIRQYRHHIPWILVLCSILVWELAGHEIWQWRVPIKRKQEKWSRLLLVADPQLQGFRNEPPGLVGMLTRWDVNRYVGNHVKAGFEHVQPDYVVFLGDLLDEGSIASPGELSEYAYRFHQVFPWSRMPWQTFIPGDNDIGGEGGESITAEKVALFSKYFAPTNGVHVLADGLRLVRVNTLAASGIADQAVREEMEHFLKQQQDERNAATSSSVLLSHLPASQLRGAYVISVFRLLKTASVLSAHDHYLHYAAINPANGDVYESKEFSACKLLELDAANLPCYQQNFTRCVLDVTVPTVSYRMGVSCMALTVADIDGNGRIQRLLVVPLPLRYPVLAAYLLLLLVCMVVFIFLP